VVERRQIVYCPQCETHWDAELETAKCTHGGHDHQRFEMHRHLDSVAFPDGVTVTAASFDSANPYGRERPPDYGLYFDPRWNPPWEHDHLVWRDFGVPDSDSLLAALQGVREGVRAGRVTEVGCIGGHGRTGTALACLAVLSGVRSDEAVAWVRASYCADAVETPRQAAFVTSWVLDP
jgi:hypothetical protein